MESAGADNKLKMNIQCSSNTNTLPCVQRPFPSYNVQVHKPLHHYTYEEWLANNSANQLYTKNKCVTGTSLREEDRKLRNEVFNRKTWKLRDVDISLGDRINELEQWKLNMNRTLAEVENQIRGLNQAKDMVEKCLVSNMSLLEAARECMRMRDIREGVDQCNDHLYVQICREVRLIERNCDQLRQKGNEAFEQFCHLKDIQDKIMEDLRNKNSTLCIDRYQLQQTPASTDTSFKPYPWDIQPGATNLDQWLYLSSTLRNNGEREAANGRQMSVDCLGAIRSSNNEISQQREATEFAYRQRIYETKTTRDRLRNQRDDLIQEQDRLIGELKMLENSLADSRGYLKLSHTRIENRKFRPGIEVCADHVHRGLREETNQLDTMRAALSCEIAETKTVLNGVQLQLHIVEADLARKEKSLALENESHTLHQRPHTNPYQSDNCWLLDGRVYHTTVGRSTPWVLKDREKTYCEKAVETEPCKEEHDKMVAIFTE